MFTDGVKFNTSVVFLTKIEVACVIFIPGFSGKCDSERDRSRELSTNQMPLLLTEPRAISQSYSRESRGIKPHFSTCTLQPHIPYRDGKCDSARDRSRELSTNQMPLLLAAPRAIYQSDTHILASHEQSSRISARSLVHT